MVLMIIAALVVLGLCLGSFVNALVWRVHEQEQETAKKKPSQKYLKKLSITKGRSICPHCQHELAAKDLVPVVSWLYLRGKCRYCHQPISWQYPLVESLTAILFVVSYSCWPTGLGHLYQQVLFGLWLLLVTGFMALSVYDIRWYLLPNRLLYPLYAPAVVWTAIVLSHVDKRPITVLVELAGALFIGGGLFYGIYQLSRGKWIGGGDVRLGWLLGLIVLTPPRALLFIFIASLLGCLVAIPLMSNKRLKRSSVVPFGPFLMAGAFLTVLFGARLLDWYHATFLNF